MFTALFVAGAFKVRLEHAASTVTVTVWPVKITAVAPAVGTIPPVHVAGLFQLPDIAELIASALEEKIKKQEINTVKESKVFEIKRLFNLIAFRICYNIPNIISQIIDRTNIVGFTCSSSSSI